VILLAILRNVIALLTEMILVKIITTMLGSVAITVSKISIVTTI
jgi:hypothetical protein